MGLDSGNKRVIKKLVEDIHKEAQKESKRQSRLHPIKLPVQATPVSGRLFFGDRRLSDRPDLHEEPIATTHNTFHGPVVIQTGDGRMQVAWNSNQVHQGQATEQIASGFEQLAQVVADTLKDLAAAGLDAEDHHEAETAANEALVAITQPEPDRSRVKRAVATLKGLLAPVAVGVATGAGQGAQEWARSTIENLSQALN